MMHSLSWVKGHSPSQVRSQHPPRSRTLVRGTRIRHGTRSAEGLSSKAAPLCDPARLPAGLAHAWPLSPGVYFVSTGDERQRLTRASPFLFVPSPFAGEAFTRPRIPETPIAGRQNRGSTCRKADQVHTSAIDQVAKFVHNAHATRTQHFLKNCTEKICFAARTPPPSFCFFLEVPSFCVWSIAKFVHNAHATRTQHFFLKNCTEKICFAARTPPPSFCFFFRGPIFLRLGWNSRWLR
jgi:hypothetical protein